MSISCTNGLSGDIYFDDMGWRITTAAYVTLYREISSSNSLERVLIGIVKKDRESHPKFMYTNNESSSTVWSGGCIATIVHALAIDLFSSLPPVLSIHMLSAMVKTGSGNGVDVFTCMHTRLQRIKFCPPHRPHPPFPALWKLTMGLGMIGDEATIILLLNAYNYIWTRTGDAHPPVRTVINRIALPLTVIYYTLAALGILFAIFCVGFNLKYRDCKYVDQILAWTCLSG